MTNDSSAGFQALITDPNMFFRHRTESPNFLSPVGIVLLVAVLTSIAALPRADVASELATSMVQSQGQQVNQSVSGVISAASNILAVFGAVLGTVITWGLYAIVFYLIARVAFDGNGSFTDTLALTGWGFVPAIFDKLVSIAAAYYVFGGETLPAGSHAAQNAFEQLQSDPVLLIAGGIGIGLLLWSGVLWVSAMEHLHNLSRIDAFITVCIPLVLGLLRRLNGLL
ncbi:Yip1 family protein [Halocatena marina]|uniref:YIP1 family protein n=1 Tax=Halocatena marina TaxID=2934937 RepID=A0ABD5YHM3_9EURY|nr:Yip1 family protein [Halocatena marina]